MNTYTLSNLTAEEIHLIHRALNEVVDQENGVDELQDKIIGQMPEDFFDEFDSDKKDEGYQMPDNEADAATLASAGMGTDEDYGRPSHDVDTPLGEEYGNGFDNEV